MRLEHVERLLENLASLIEGPRIPLSGQNGGHGAGGQQPAPEPEDDYEPDEDEPEEDDYEDEPDPSELNSEDEPIASSPEALAQFQRWFEGSRVTDADDRPLVVYHGSGAKFDVFEAGEFGFHFGDEAAAGMFGSNPYRCYLNIQNPLWINRDLGNWKPEDMLKELVRELGGGRNRQTPGEVARGDRAAALRDVRRLRGVHKDDLAQDDDMFRHSKALYNTGESVRKLYEKHGYDGVVYRNEAEGYGNSWIAFRPNQVKRADNKTFNPRSPKMHEETD